MRTRQDARSSVNSQGLLAVREGCRDAPIDGSRLDIALGLTIGLDRLERQGVVALGKFKGDAGYGGGGAMLDGQDDALVAIAAEILTFSK